MKVLIIMKTFDTFSHIGFYKDNDILILKVIING